MITLGSLVWLQTLMLKLRLIQDSFLSCEYRLIVLDNNYHRLISLHRPLKPNHHHLNIIIWMIKLPLGAAYPTSPFVLLVNTEHDKCRHSLHDTVTFNYTLFFLKLKTLWHIEWLLLYSGYLWISLQSSLYHATTTANTKKCLLSLCVFSKTESTMAASAASRYTAINWFTLFKEVQRVKWGMFQRLTKHLSERRHIHV